MDEMHEASMTTMNIRSKACLGGTGAISMQTPTAPLYDLLWAKLKCLMGSEDGFVSHRESADYQRLLRTGAALEPEYPPPDQPCVNSSVYPF